MQIKLIEWEIFFFKMPETKQFNERMTAHSIENNMLIVNMKLHLKQFENFAGNLSFNNLNNLKSFLKHVQNWFQSFTILKIKAFIPSHDAYLSEHKGLYCI